MGRAAATAFAAEGAALAICARNQKALEAAATDLQKTPGVQVLAQPADVTDVDAVKRFTADVIKKFGRIDVCVANSGGPPAKNFLSTTLEEWRRAVDVNFLS